MPGQNNGDDQPIVAASFTITYDDCQAMLLAQPRNKLKGWKAHAFIIAAALVNIGFSAFIVNRFDGTLFGWNWVSYVNAFLGFGILLMSYVLRPIFQRRHYRAAGLHDQLLEFTADAKGIHSAREGLRTEFDWDKLVVWSESDRHFFFWINQIQAFIVPKRALAGSDDLEMLRRFATDAGAAKV